MFSSNQASVRRAASQERSATQETPPEAALTGSKPRRLEEQPGGAPDAIGEDHNGVITSVLDPEGRIAGMLGTASLRRHAFKELDALVRAIIECTAWAIEERSFREKFSAAWIISVASRDTNRPNALFAVDGDQCIVGANRYARQMGPHDLSHSGASFWAVFARDPALFAGKQEYDDTFQLKLIGTSEAVLARVTSPRQTSAKRINGHVADGHTQRSRKLVHGRSEPSPRLLAQGGLPPKVLRRVNEYIDVHLEQTVRLKELAKVAGLSVFHFARAFKRSVGVTPNRYLSQRRVLRAQQLLADSDMSLSQIAFATGFSDQSYFARRFREQVGTTPSKFRWSKR